ncbi:MAG TPA: DUF3098 domain-containing protein [Saprospiraceae bacterium]|nr:DUF3098 domain-containing protein [Saprospiraceae bacterium]
MSKSNPKKVVQTTASRVRPESGTTKKSGTSFLSNKEELIFNKSNYVWMGIGVGAILLGLLLMMGGSMPDPNTWDPNIIYSFRRTVLAPFLILVGLGIEVYAIFKK